MKRKYLKKVVRGMGILLAMVAAVLAAGTLRFAVFAPELLTRIFHVIGG